ncbi:MAG TPA: chloride channel protein [Bacteroidia bacterium]|nr:chloride channel protein [Bacteroidia bacterium]HRS58375.1 chloride channel protein [Bacteroidia bacterium]HRU67325.1 chloride channel protein [Bacteroidia bacterium]
MNRFEKYLRLFLVWRVRNIKDKPFILILSVLIGLLTGLAAVVLKNTVHFIQEVLVKQFSDLNINYLYLFYPFMGILFTTLIIKYIIKKPLGHGVPATLLSISRQNAIMPLHSTYSSIITSAFTVGFGGSVGLEGPTISTGASIGSNVGRLLRLDFRNRALLMACAASGAMAAMFKAPIAAVIFSIEVLMLDLTLSSMIPLLLASSVAVLTSYFFFGRDVLLHPDMKNAFFFHEVPFFVLLGILTGFFSVHFTRGFYMVSGFFNNIKNTFTKILAGGVFLGVLIFIFPPLFGEGYESINFLLQGNHDVLLKSSLFFPFRDNVWMVILFLGSMVFFKTFATAATLGAGGIGGIFAPSLFMGSLLGYTSGLIANELFNLDVSLISAALVGMTGTVAGVLHAPLTAIFLIAEVSSGYDLIIPLMMTSAISYSTMRYFEKYSIYTSELAKQGDLLTHHKDKTVLTLLKVPDLVEKNFLTVSPDDSLRTLVKLIKESVRNIFPVVSEDGDFLGLIPLDNIRKIMFEQEMYDNVFVRDLMIQPGELVTMQDNMDIVMEKFKSSGHWNLPVVDNGKYIGFVSRANIFNAYRNMLLRFSED